MTLHVPLEALLKVVRDGDEVGWDAEFEYLWATRQSRMDMLTTSIQEVGIQNPILIGGDGRVWDGHHRLAAAHKLGLDQVPIVWSSLTPGRAEDAESLLNAEMKRRRTFEEMHFREASKRFTQRAPADPSPDESDRARVFDEMRDIDNSLEAATAGSRIWHRSGQEWPFIVWEGKRGSAATGRAYRRRWQAILAAWWVSRFTQQDVWIEHRSPKPELEATP